VKSTFLILALICSQQALAKEISFNAAISYAHYDRDGNVIDESTSSGQVQISAQERIEGQSVYYRNLRIQVGNSRYRVASDTNGSSFDIYCRLLDSSRPNALGMSESGSLLGGIGSMLTSSTFADLSGDQNNVRVDVVTSDGAYSVELNELECSSKKRDSIDF